MMYRSFAYFKSRKYDPIVRAVARVFGTRKTAGFAMATGGSIYIPPFVGFNHRLALANSRYLPY